ncbi:MAG: hypothetical protein O2964_14520 [Verrucomicrobia bacterium]|nr:hypothetical protein [Verrucomicrobiota bacterium]
MPDFENATPNPKAMKARPMSEAKIRKNSGGDPNSLNGALHIEMITVKPITPKIPKMKRKKMGKPDGMLF